MSTKSRLRSMLAYIEEQGLAVLAVEHGRHIKVSVRLPDSRERKIILPVSPTGSNGDHNMRAFIRRMARGQTP
jgi:hypothetical protein